MPLPFPLALSRFKQLPQRTSEVWQGGLVRLPAWIENPSDPNGAPARPIGAVWVSLRTGRVNLQLPSEGKAASPELALLALVDFAAKESKASKAFGGRPARVEVRGPELKEALEAALAGTGTAVVTVDDLPAVKEVLRQFERAETPVPYPGLLDTPGMTVERVRAFAWAAARFHNASPWHHLTNEDLLEADVEFHSISVEPPEARKDMAHICVLGNGGQQFGLAFFESRRAFEQTLEQLDPRKTRRAFGVTFGPAEDLSFADVDLWEDHCLPVAGPHAYPVAADFRVDRILRPDTRTLTYMEALLCALGDTTEDELDSGRWQREVITFDGPVTLTLSLPYMLEAELGDGAPQRGAPRPATMPRLAERGSAQVARFLAQREFASVDEVNHALQEARQQGLFDEPPEVVAGRSLTPLAQAQELAYHASEVTGRLRIKLARKALALSVDCADAHVTLGEAASTLEAALDCYRRGVDAGARALGQQRLSEETGELWAHLGARPYLRARLAVAQALRDLGRVDEALAHTASCCVSTATTTRAFATCCCLP